MLPFSGYKESALIHPHNVLPTSSIRCMNCAEMVASTEMEGHIRSKHQAAYEVQENGKKSGCLSCCQDKGDTFTIVKPKDSVILPAYNYMQASKFDHVPKIPISGNHDVISAQPSPNGKLACQSLSPSGHDLIYQPRELQVEQYSAKTARPMKYGRNLPMDWEENERIFQSDKGGVISQKNPARDEVYAHPFQNSAKEAEMPGDFFNRKLDRKSGHKKMTCNSFYEKGKQVLDQPKKQEQWMYVPYSVPITQQGIIQPSPTGCCSCYMHCQACNCNCNINCESTPAPAPVPPARTFSIPRKDYEVPRYNRVQNIRPLSARSSYPEPTSSYPRVRRTPPRYVKKVVMEPIIRYEQIEQEQRFLPIRKQDYLKAPHNYKGAILKEQFDKYRWLKDRDQTLYQSRLYKEQRAYSRGMPIQAHEMKGWQEVYESRMGKGRDQQFDRSVTEAFYEGVRTKAQYLQFLMRKAALN